MIRVPADHTRFDAYLEDLRELVSIDSGGRNKMGVDAVNDWLWVEPVGKPG